jgi:hypothetical protein
MVYYDSVAKDLVIKGSQSPAPGTYSISVTGSLKSADGYECSSITFDLAVTGGQSCPTTIVIAPSDTTATAQQQELTQENQEPIQESDLCLQGDLELTDFEPTYQFSCLRNLTCLNTLSFSDNKNGACLGGFTFQLDPEHPEVISSLNM